MVTFNFSQIQTSNQELNRIQTNLGNTFSSVSNLFSQVSVIGEVKFSPLSLEQFQQQVGPSWVSADGVTSVLRTTYNTLTNALVAPLVTAPIGTNAYIRVN
jgi:hypothetical protein